MWHEHRHCCLRSISSQICAAMPANPPAAAMGNGGRGKLEWPHQCVWKASKTWLKQLQDTTNNLYSLYASPTRNLDLDKSEHHETFELPGDDTLDEEAAEVLLCVEQKSCNRSEEKTVFSFEQRRNHTKTTRV